MSKSKTSPAAYRSFFPEACRVVPDQNHFAADFSVANSISQKVFHYPPGPDLNPHPAAHPHVHHARALRPTPVRFEAPHPTPSATNRDQHPENKIARQNTPIA